MAIISKAAVNRSVIARTVVSSLRTQGPQVVAVLEERIYGGQPPAGMTWGRLVEDLADYLEKSTEHTSTLSSLVLTEAAQDVAATQTLTLTAEELRDEIQWQREQISATYGRKIAADFGFSGVIPQSPDQLVALSKVLEDRLQNNEFPTQTRRARSPLDRLQLADLLAAARTETTEAATDNAREARETQQARQARNLGTETWNTAYRGVATIAVGLFQLADMPALAERVRPTARRRQQLPEDIDLKDPVDPQAVDEPQTLDEPQAPTRTELLQPINNLEEEAID